MKYFSLNINYLLIVLGLLFATSCQKDTLDETENIPEGETISINSPLMDLLYRTSLNDSNNDDFIDGGTCFSINFPFTVVISTTEIVVENEDGYQDIIDFVINSDSSLSDLELSFPIVITFSDYSETIINSDEELLAFASECEIIEQECIDCIKIVYPIQFYTFNSNTEQTSTNNFLNDKELFMYVSNLSETHYFTIEYPVNVLLNNGSSSMVNSNESFKNLINNCENLGVSQIGEYTDYLTTDSWYISYLFTDETENTSNFCEFQFTFVSENIVEVSYDSTLLLTGNWNMIAVSNDVKILLDFPNEIPFEELNKDWNLSAGNNTTFDFVSNNGDEFSFRRSETLCDGDPINQVKGILETGVWYVSYFYHSEDNTSDFCEFEFKFNEDDTVSVTSEGSVVEGVWYVGENTDGLFLGLNFNGEDLPFDYLFNNWNILSFNMNNIESEIDCECGGTHQLFFGRSSVICQEDSLFLKQILESGIWYVAEYFDNGIDETLTYYYYDINFVGDNTVIAIYETEVIEGTWSVIGAEGNLGLVLDFGENVPFNEFNNTWAINDILVGRVKVENNNNGTDSIKFLKL